MKIIITEDQYGQLTEMIKLDIKVGDTIMGGKFKNKKVVVKTIGKNDKGDITINGKPLLRFRIIKESTSIDKNKNKDFLTNLMGIDFSDKIQQITSTYDVPTSFDDGIAPSTIRTYLNHWGPMYLFEFDGVKYLYQNRGDFEMFIDEDGYWHKEEIPEKLGIGILGLKFSDIIDMYFDEENM
jgi:hypothetical protein